MPSIAFTSHLREIGPVEPISGEGATLCELLDMVAADYPRVKTYVLDDQGRLRKHIAVFVDGSLQQRDRVLSLSLSPAAKVYVMQALSGG
jgi:molybdopterin synthase sulfur carrier subunit